LSRWSLSEVLPLMRLSSALALALTCSPPGDTHARTHARTHTHTHTQVPRCCKCVEASWASTSPPSPVPPPSSSPPHSDTACLPTTRVCVSRSSSPHARVPPLLFLLPSPWAWTKVEHCAQHVATRPRACKAATLTSAVVLVPTKMVQTKYTHLTPKSCVNPI